MSICKNPKCNMYITWIKKDGKNIPINKDGTEHHCNWENKEKIFQDMKNIEEKEKFVPLPDPPGSPIDSPPIKTPAQSPPVDRKSREIRQMALLKVAAVIFEKTWNANPNKLLHENVEDATGWTWTIMKNLEARIEKEAGGLP